MEITVPIKLQRESDCIKLFPLQKNDLKLFDLLLQKNAPYIDSVFKTPLRAKTYDQVKTVWKLVEVIFFSMENRKPTTEEKKQLYEDLLEEYAERRPSKLNPDKLIPVHVSKSDTKACAYFIEGLMLHLSQYCDLNMDAQTEVRALLFEWSAFMGNLGAEFIDNCSESEYHQRHPYSEASGKGGTLHLHHIVHKGSHEELRHITANWVMLTPEEHNDLHSNGEEQFLCKYPHLRDKFNRAKSLRNKIYVD